MANTANDERRGKRSYDIDEDETLREVGEDHDFGDIDDELDAADRRRDPLRIPH